MKEEKGSLMKRRFLSILLACAMIVTLLPAVSYAETGEANTNTAAEQTAAANTEKSIQMGLPVTTTVNTTISITVNGKEIRSNGLCLMIKPIQAKMAFSCCLRV